VIPIDIIGVIAHRTISIAIQAESPMNLVKNIIDTKESPENTICVLESGSANVVTISIIRLQHIYELEMQKIFTITEPIDI